MKLLVLSNISGSTDLVLDALGDSNSVVAKEANLATDAMTSIVWEQMNKRAYDRILVIAKDPIGAGMAMNKLDGIEAAVCGSIDDVKLANENGANVIIIRDPRSKELQNILGQIVPSGSVLQGLKLNVKMPQFLPRHGAENEMPEISAPRKAPLHIRKRKEKPNPEEAQQEEDQVQQEEAAQVEEPREPRKGVMGKLKDYLGIM